MSSDKERTVRQLLDLLERKDAEILALKEEIDQRDGVSRGCGMCMIDADTPMYGAPGVFYAGEGEYMACPFCTPDLADEYQDLVDGGVDPRVAEAGLGSDLAPEDLGLLALRFLSGEVLEDFVAWLDNLDTGTALDIVAGNHAAAGTEEGPGAPGVLSLVPPISQEEPV